MKPNIALIIKNFLRYISGIYALDHAPQHAKERGLKAALLFLRKSYFFYNPATVKFLKKLYPYLINLEDHHTKISHCSNKKNFIIHFCCWGESYCEKVKNCLLPSLLANNNLPWSSEQYNLILLIHADKQSQNTLSNSEVFSKIKLYSTIQFIDIPSKLLKSLQSSTRYPEILFLKKLNIINSNIKYLLLGGIQTHAFNIALKERAYISFLMPDVILSDNFLKMSFSLLGSKKVLVNTAFRVLYPQFKKDLTSFYTDKSATVLSISPQELIKLKLKHIHPASKRQIVSSQTEDFIPTAQLLFKTIYGIIIRAFHYHPILLDCQKILHPVMLDYLPIDNSILNNILLKEMPYEQQVKVCDDSSSIAFAELSDEHINRIFSSTHTRLSYEELIYKTKNLIVNYRANLDNPLNHYFLSTRHKFISDEAIFTPQECINDVDFLFDLNKQT